jgi:acyl-ACP thioesterase
MSYSFHSRIRYSEIGEDECLTLNGVINYFQDCSTFHSDDVGLGLRKLKQADRGWVLSSWQIVVNRYPSLGENIEVSTWPYSFRGFLGSRNFTMRSYTGELLAYANSLWVFMDTKKGRPTLITGEFIDGYHLEQPLSMEYASRKVKMPEVYMRRKAFSVKRHHLDTNHHVNNGQYIQMAREFIPSDFPIYQMRAEYRKQAVLNDMVTPKIHREGETYTVALCQESGDPYAVIEFARKGEIE